MGYLKRCANCHKVYEGNKCPECSRKSVLHSTKKRQRENEGLKLYGSPLWKKCRKNIRIKYMDYDIWLLGAGIVRKCPDDDVVIHHIKERDEAPELIYSMDNLITVTSDSHAEIHSWYRTRKSMALDRINKGIKEFYRLMGDGYA